MSDYRIYTETLTSASGTFYIGDLCYCMSSQNVNVNVTDDNDGWNGAKGFVNKSLSQQNYYNDDQNARPNVHDVVKTEYFVPFLNRDVSVLSVSTQHGDGEYSFEYDKQKVILLNKDVPRGISVDAGLIGVVAYEDMLEQPDFLESAALLIKLPENDTSTQKTIKYRLIIQDDDCDCCECGGDGCFYNYETDEYDDDCAFCNGTGIMKIKAHHHQVLNENNEIIVDIVS